MPHMPILEVRGSDQHFIKVDSQKSLAARTSLFVGEPAKFKLEWRALKLSVLVKNPQTKTVSEKDILKDVSGGAESGELLAIMGPSGAGKSSLLDCISGRNRAVEGDILVNGEPWTKATKRLASYVMQDDLFYDTITVKEHLVFQARLRMGKTFSEAQHMQRVNEVMEELGLMKCRDTLIGGISLRGISGGERKRLSFASEILTNPSILFVDEPTSGLDSYMAESVVNQLRQLSRGGRTVVATIHQPSSEIFALFDQLYLLADGSPVYHGDALNSVDYFGALGYPCPALMNPSDHFMRQLVVVDKEVDKTGVQRVEALKLEWAKRCPVHPATSAGTTRASTANDEDVFSDSRLSLVAQTRVLTSRNFVRFVRDRLAFHAAILQSIFVAVLIGLIYLQLEVNQRGIQNFVGGFFFLILEQTFGPANATFIAVPLELPIVIREYNAGLYHLASWYISKNLSELPMQVLIPVITFVPVYFLMGIGHGFEVFFAMQIIIILVNSTAIGIGYMVSCLSGRVDLAPILGIITLLPFLLFGGLFINSEDCPEYFVWIQYLSPIKYGFEALMTIFWTRVPVVACNIPSDDCTAGTGEQVLESFSVSDRSEFMSGVILVALNIMFRVVGFVGFWLKLRNRA